jgi:N-acyl-L-homoserine lactone synthetase
MDAIHQGDGAMIHIVTSENRHLYGPQLWAMHEQRREQCVEKNGWIDLVVLDGGEVDDYDDSRAIYLLASMTRWRWRSVCACIPPSRAACWPTSSPT